MSRIGKLVLLALAIAVAYCAYERVGQAMTASQIDPMEIHERSVKENGV